MDVIIIKNHENNHAHVSGNILKMQTIEITTITFVKSILGLWLSDYESAKWLMAHLWHAGLLDEAILELVIRFDHGLKSIYHGLFSLFNLTSG